MQIKSGQEPVEAVQGSANTFINYAREDREVVLELAKKLKATGVIIWMDQRDIPAGAPWDRSVEDALKNCARVLVILTPASVSSANVMDEVSYALDKGKMIIPVLAR
jgi:hypothetical protein